MTGSLLSRRHFIQGALATGSALSLRPRVAFGSTTSAATGDTLVLVVLRGGLDGLSALPPLGDGGAYHDARPGIAVPDSRALPVDDRFGMHPALAPLHELFVDGLLALVPAVGSPSASRSHFDQQRVLERGAIDHVSGVAGWLARHLEARQATPLQAVAGGAQLPEVLYGARSAIAVPSLDGFVERLARTGDLASGGALMERLSGDGRLGAAAASSVAAAAELLALPPASGLTDAYPGVPEAQHLRDVARLLAAGINLDAAVVDFGGWDLHAAMGDVDRGPMQARLTALAEALAAFHTDTAALPRPVSLVVVSEFGRTLAANGTGGTDHGRGGLALLLGRGIRGGVFGPWHGLSDDVLDDGDVPVATDFRDVLAEVVTVRLDNADVGAVFPGWAPQPLGFARPLA